MLAEINMQQGLGWIALLMIVGYFYFRSIRTSPPPERVPFAKLNAEKAAERAAQPPAELMRWQVEMHETARDLKAELDSKMVALKTTIRF